MHSINRCNLSGTQTCNRSMRGCHLAYAATKGIYYPATSTILIIKFTLDNYFLNFVERWKRARAMLLSLHFFVSPRRSWMNYEYRFGLLGNSSNASAGVNGPSYNYIGPATTIVPAVLLSILTLHARLFPLFLCRISFLQFPLASVWKNTRA